MFKQQYCSIKCRGLDNRGINNYCWKNIEKKFCKFCNKELTRNQIMRNNIFCSHLCYSKNKLKKLPIKYCPVCKKKLTRQKVMDNQICCSWECRNKFFIGDKTYCWNNNIEEKTCFICGGKTRRTSKKSVKLCSNECRKKYQVGKNNPNYKNGLSKEPYGSEFNDELKGIIRKRDGYRCGICNISEDKFYNKLTIHHIDYDKKNNNPKNLITTCATCNSHLNANREYWKLKLMGENNDL